MFTCTTKTSQRWAYGGTVDTPVLGTGLERGKSSNLFTPTKSNTWKKSYSSSKLHGIGSCTRSCTCCISCVNIKIKGADTKANLQSTSLRN